MSPFQLLLLSLTVTVSNPLPEARENVPVVVKLPAKGAEVRSVSIAGHPDMPWQLDDMNRDGRADELVMMLDLKPSETVKLNVNLSEKEPTTEFEAKTEAYIKLNDKNQKHPRIQAISYPGDADNRQMYNSIYGHGAVLEGLYSAIRLYMDNRQSVDLYAKNHPQLELETTGFYTTVEQMENGYGRDILWAGTSVALGSFRGWSGTEPLTIDSVDTRGQSIVTTGPLRSVVEVTDRGWVMKPGDKPVDMTQRYTIYAGRRDYQVDIHISGAPAGAVYCTGVQKVMEDNTGFVNQDGLAGSWGWNIPEKKYQELKDTLGLGIYVPKPFLYRTIEDDVNYLTLLQPDSRGNIRYTFTSAALRDETSPRTAEAWFAWLKRWKKELANPVKVTVK
ncbi:MAG: DUF4861 domain-containing protein [Muribaculaceae bacterium]|nr:DUF4861 domain-containing protein [Muribaculaceae bacterium]